MKKITIFFVLMLLITTFASCASANINKDISEINQSSKDDDDSMNKVIKDAINNVGIIRKYNMSGWVITMLNNVTYHQISIALCCQGGEPEAVLYYNNIWISESDLRDLRYYYIMGYIVDLDYTGSFIDNGGTLHDIWTL